MSALRLGIPEDRRAGSPLHPVATCRGDVPGLRSRLEVLGEPASARDLGEDDEHREAPGAWNLSHRKGQSTFGEWGSRNCESWRILIAGLCCVMQVTHWVHAPFIPGLVFYSVLLVSWGDSRPGNGNRIGDPRDSPEGDRANRAPYPNRSGVPVRRAGSRSAIRLTCSAGTGERSSSFGTSSGWKPELLRSNRR